MAERDDEKRKTVPHAYQEGGVDALHERPAGTDEDDRTGQGRPPEVSADRAQAPDAFVSEEVDARDRQRHRGSRKTRS
jgi:hypothetical protein